MRVVTVLALCVCISYASSAFAATIDLPEGVDLLVVLPGSTVNFTGPYAIPADFFGPGSDPFSGVIEVQGVPLEPDLLCQGGDPAPGQILIRRDPVVIPDPPSSVQVPIEIVQMKLVSAAPITVTFNGGQNPQLWDIEIVPIVPPIAPAFQRKLIINRASPNGGAFTVEYEYDMLHKLTRVFEPSDPPGPPIERTPPPDQFGGQGPWGIPALPDITLPYSRASLQQLECPPCKADDFYLGFDGAQPVAFNLVGQFLNLQVIIACTSTVPVEYTTWGTVKSKYRE